MDQQHRDGEPAGGYGGDYGYDMAHDLARDAAGTGRAAPPGADQPPPQAGRASDPLEDLGYDEAGDFWPPAHRPHDSAPDR